MSYRSASRHFVNVHSQCFVFNPLDEATIVSIIGSMSMSLRLVSLHRRRVGMLLFPSFFLSFFLFPTIYLWREDVCYRSRPKRKRLQCFCCGNDAANEEPCSIGIRKGRQLSNILRRRHSQKSLHTLPPFLSLFLLDIVCWLLGGE